MSKDFVELCEYNIRDYSSAVNEARAIPDAATGLKPIHRKILYEMWADKILSKGKFKKCAYMVGQLLSRFSPHGDTATYDALVRMSQPWIQRYPLLDFHGNNGSAIGDSQAAMRYTESKLAKIAEDGFLASLDKDPVDWEMNFSNEEREPSSLPAVFPGLFCLPNQGMGYACSCNFLTYNLTEIGNYLISYINGNTNDEVPCYDIATGGTLITPKAMETIAKTGKGTVVFEAKYDINGADIVFSEFPFGVMLDKVYDDIQSLYEKDMLPWVSDFRNDSENGQLKLLVKCKDKSAVQETIDFLFDKTPLRSSYAINQVALVGKTPRLLTLADMCETYVSHNLSCIKREHQFDLDKTLARIEVLEGLAKALGDIDGLVRLIKNSESGADARAKLEGYGFTTPQIDAILNMRLTRLAHLEVSEVLKELEEKRKLASELKAVVESEDAQKQVLVERLQALVREFGDSRRTKVVQKDVTRAKRESVKREKVVEDTMICLDSLGYMKSVPIPRFRTSSDNVREEKARTDSMIVMVSNHGRAYRLKASSIKQCLNSEKGTALGSILSLGPDEAVCDFFVAGEDASVIAVTSGGYVKVLEAKTLCGATQDKVGKDVCGLREGDFVVCCKRCDGASFVILTSGEGSLAIPIDSIAPSGRASKGKIGAKVRDGETITLVMVANTLPANMKAGKRGQRTKK